MRRLSKTIYLILGISILLSQSEYPPKYIFKDFTPAGSIEALVEENFDAWLITQDFNNEQKDFIRLLKNRFIANGKADIEDLFEPPLSYFNAGSKGVELFGEELLVDMIDDLNQNIFKRAV